MAQNLKNVLKHNTLCFDQGRTLQVLDKARFFFPLIIKYALPSGTYFDIVNLNASKKHTEQWTGTT